MKRSRLLRSSFIVVTASVAAAAAVACSSSTNASATGDNADSGGPNPAGCPATAPTPQGSCSGTLTCSYDGGASMNACGTFPNVTTAQCNGGTWLVSGTAVGGCNPPGPIFEAGTDATNEGGEGGDDGGDD